MKQNIVCLDWSNIVFRSLYSINGFGSNYYTFNTDEEINSLIARIATDVAYLLRIFNPQKVVFAADSKHSWRKDVLDTYKSGREKDEKLNWERIYGALDEYKKHLSTLGYVFIETRNAEADDMMALVKELVFEDPTFAFYNLIIISADADIRQLIDFKQNTCQYCTVFNEIGRGPGGKRHWYCNQTIMDWYEDRHEDEKTNDIFNFTSSVDPDKEYIKNILDTNKKIVLDATDPENILLSKIFCGDDGDSVPSFYEWYNDKGKKVRVTNSKFVKIIESLGTKSIALIDMKKRQLKPILESVCKRKINDINVEERLERQEKLVQLSSSIFPEHIREYKSEIKNLIIAQEPLSCISLKMSDLLTGSKFDEVLKKKKTHRDADIFTNLNNYIDSHSLTPLF